MVVHRTVLLSRVLPDRASRWANVVAALAAIAVVLVPTLVPRFLGGPVQLRRR
jgi:hypothetical protein